MKTLWMKVTNDKYEYPLIITESAKDLADIVGITKSGLISMIAKQEKGIRNCPYRRVRIEEGGEDNED